MKSIKAARLDLKGGIAAEVLVASSRPEFPLTILDRTERNNDQTWT